MGCRHRPAYLLGDDLADLFDIHADQLGQIVQIAAHQRPVADAGQQWCGRPDCLQAAIDPVEIVLGDHVAHHEAIERHPAAHQLPHRGLPRLEPQIARIQTVRLHRHIGLRNEGLIETEHLQRSSLTGRVPIEGEDHLAIECIVVAHQPLQHPCVIGSERRATRSHSSVDAGEVARHHVGVALDDDRLGLLADRLPGQVESVQHMRLLVDDGLRGVQVLRGHPVVVENSSRPETEHGLGRVLDRPDHPALEVVPARLTDQPGPDQLLIAESGAMQMIVQGFAILGGISHAEVLGGFPIETAAVDELAEDHRLRAGDLALIELRGRLIGGQHPLPQARLGGRAAVVADAQLDAGLVGQRLDGLGETQIVDLLEKGDDIATLAAAEAVVEAPRWRHLKTGGLLVMERAQPLQ
ncbi:hypothetical protein SDC9_71514 [bioreactor metagenome]|uniref:Uncharacterized protein n=1 Tax=bioreactor metagenome TaxID=1076179 RepID=A0A644Y8Z4_9ZZZZ